jgi:drug/metabolite transporter (DMT)-like permease
MGKLYAALFMLSLIWGTSFLFIKVLVIPIGAWGVVFGRCLFGALILIVIVTVRKEWPVLKSVPLKMIILVSLFNNAIPWVLIALSETKISSSYASLINATTPIWTVIIGYAFYHNKLRLLQWFGIVLGFSGIVLLSGLRFSNIMDQSFVGLFTMLGATICYGLSTHLSKKHLKKVSILMISTSTLLVSTIISFFMVVMTNPRTFSMLIEPTIFFALIGLGVFGSGLAYILYYYCIQEGSPEFASLVTYMVPVTAMLWGSLILKEEIHYTMVVGFLIILSGVYLSSKKQSIPEKSIRVSA